MEVCIIEKIHHNTNDPRLSIPLYTWDIENYWIKELGTAMLGGCNVNIKGVGNINIHENSDMINSVQ